MKHFIIVYLNGQGETSRLRVQSLNVQTARLNSRIPERRIVSVRPDILWSLRQFVDKGTPGMKNQAIFLQNLSSALATQKTIRESVSTLVKNSSWLNIKQEKLDQCEELADFLRLLRFDKNSILLAETAQRTGQYSQALRRASRYLIEQEQVGAEVQKELRMGYVYLVCGLLFLIFLPFFMNYAIAEIRGAVGAQFNGNQVTQCILLWHQIIQVIWPFCLVLVPIIIWFRWSLLLYMKRVPFFVTVYYKRILDRAMRFLSAYELLHEAGVVDSQAIVSLLQASDGDERALYQRIYARLASSQDLAGAFTQEDWPMVLQDLMRAMPHVNFEEKQKMMISVKETLYIEHLHITRVLAAFVSKAGFLMMLCAVIAAAIGFYVPLANMASNFG